MEFISQNTQNFMVKLYHCNDTVDHSLLKIKLPDILLNFFHLLKVHEFSWTGIKVCNVDKNCGNPVPTWYVHNICITEEYFPSNGEWELSMKYMMCHDVSLYMALVYFIIVFMYFIWNTSKKNTEEYISIEWI